VFEQRIKFAFDAAQVKSLSRGKRGAAGQDNHDERDNSVISRIENRE
jgi:hypothetical protein